MILAIIGITNITYRRALRRNFADIMKLGLLFETGIDVARETDQSTYVSFQHKILQDFAAAYYIEMCFRKSRNIEVTTELILINK